MLRIEKSFPVCETNEIRHLTSTDCISADLISSKLNGCEVTLFAVAVTNHSALVSDEIR